MLSSPELSQTIQFTTTQNPARCSFTRELDLQNVIRSTTSLHNIDSEHKWEVALKSLQFYHNLKNISATNNRLTYSRTTDEGTEIFNIDFPEGTYTVNDLNDYLKYKLVENGHYWNVDFTINPPRVVPVFPINLEYAGTIFRCKISVIYGYTVDLNSSIFKPHNSPLASLGFQAGVAPFESGFITNGNFTGQLKPSFIVEKYYVRTDLIGQSNFQNTEKNSANKLIHSLDNSNILYSFILNKSSGERVIIEPDSVLLMPLGSEKISHFSIGITDENYQYLNLNSEINYELYLTRVIK